MYGNLPNSSLSSSLVHSPTVGAKNSDLKDLFGADEDHILYSETTTMPLQITLNGDKRKGKQFDNDRYGALDFTLGRAGVSLKKKNTVNEMMRGKKVAKYEHIQKGSYTVQRDNSNEKSSAALA